ncbi:MAG: J domain-containing protein [Bacteriovoracia bacterium]
MSSGKEYIRLFGLIQGLLLFAIVAAVFLRWKLSQDKKKADQPIDRLNRWSELQKEALRPQTQKEEEKPNSIKIESVFPSWTEQTDPYLILGVKKSASKEEIELAAKRLLKRFHPDRFASWDESYQKRAHHLILLVQAAKDKLVSKST